MSRYNYGNVGELQDYEFLRGKIKSIDSETDTCTVEVSGSVIDALLFYHCEPESAMRDNGAIEGAASGFSEDDNVIVQIKHDRSEARVIAHLDGIRRCRWENWDGPEINTAHPWAEGYYLASGAITVSSGQLHINLTKSTGYTPIARLDWASALGDKNPPPGNILRMKLKVQNVYGIHAFLISIESSDTSKPLFIFFNPTTEEKEYWEGLSGEGFTYLCLSDNNGETEIEVKLSDYDIPSVDNIGIILAPDLSASGTFHMGMDYIDFKKGS